MIGGWSPHFATLSVSASRDTMQSDMWDRPTKKPKNKRDGFLKVVHEPRSPGSHFSLQPGPRPEWMKDREASTEEAASARGVTPQRVFDEPASNPIARPAANVTHGAPEPLGDLRARGTRAQHSEGESEPRHGDRGGRDPPAHFPAEYDLFLRDGVLGKHRAKGAGNGIKR